MRADREIPGPSRSRSTEPVPTDDRGYNIGILDAEDRGCTACHTIEDAIEWCPKAHNGLNSYGDDMLSVTTCITCHDGRQGPVFHREGLRLAEVIHASHMGSDMFAAENGTCISCHEIDSYTGAMPLWDFVKYDRFRGLTMVSDLEGTFSFDQDVLTDNAQAFYQMSASTDPHGIPLHTSSDDSVLQERTITIGGLVDEPTELKLVDIPEELLETRIMKWDCSANGIGDAFIVNAEVTGIPFETICEMVGPQTNAIQFVSEDGKASFDVDWLIEHNAILVFQMNGENLPSVLRYPCTMMVERAGASAGRGYICEMNFVDPDGVKSFKNRNPTSGVIVGEEDAYYNKPVAAILNVRDGQIFTDTSSVTFEGYADAFDEQVAEIQFSLDRGATWQVCDTSSSTLDRWVYWTYTIDGLEPGSYDLRVRVVTDTGRVMWQDLNTIFHIQ